MTEAIDPPHNDTLFADDVEEHPNPRPYPDLLTHLMQIWDLSRPAANREAENYTDGQLETIVLQANSSLGGKNEN